VEPECWIETAAYKSNTGQVGGLLLTLMNPLIMRLPQLDNGEGSPPAPIRYCAQPRGQAWGTSMVQPLSIDDTLAQTNVGNMNVTCPSHLKGSTLEGFCHHQLLLAWKVGWYGRRYPVALAPVKGCLRPSG
jgi:hypothetical protein